jgi:RNA polymerase sigma factor (sigma-70 family)
MRGEIGEAAGATVAELAELYRGRYRRFLRVALAIVGSREAAADVVQEAFARALRSRHEFRGDGSLEAWVWQSVINIARTQRGRGQPPLNPDALDTFGVSSNGSAEGWPELRAAIAALPERQRHALFLRHYADMEYDQIGEVLGIARGTVSATLHAAHANLRRSLEGVPR